VYKTTQSPFAREVIERLQAVYAIEAAIRGSSAEEPLRRKPLSHYLTKIACLGGYLARANDPPPGNFCTANTIPCR
jgi:hypothetical protein